MSIKVGKEITEEIVDTKVLTITEKLKLAKKHLEEKYGTVAIFELPNKMYAFFRAPTESEWQIYADRVEKVMWNVNSKKAITGDSLQDVRNYLLKTCQITAGTNEVVASAEVLAKYPAASNKIITKIESMAGSDSEEVFLD